MGDSRWASELAASLLEDQLPLRWAHTRRVAAQARRLARALGPDADLIEAAAWLHDVGYSPAIAEAGFHPLDGARFLRREHQAGGALCGLVAWHSSAAEEASERGLALQLGDEFARPRRDLFQALAYCDMTSTPAGEVTTVEARLAEIHARYGAGTAVTRALGRATPELTGAVRSIEARLTAAAGELSGAAAR